MKQVKDSTIDAAKVVKPPLGLLPLWRYNELRIDEINEAIERYKEANYSVPTEWVVELNEKINWLQAHLPTSPYLSQQQPKADNVVGGWISVKDRLPENYSEFGESDYVLCLEEIVGDIPFTAWYNRNEKKWYYAHYRMKSADVIVTHWQPLPKPPIAP